MKILRAALLSLTLVPAAFGQASTGEIVGLVADASGAALANVKVTLTQQATGEKRAVTTQSNGAYIGAALPIGIYSVQAELMNFATQIKQDIVLQAGRQERIDFTLVVGQASEVVTVTGAAPLLRTTNAEIGEVFSAKRIVDLPLNGRQFVDLALLSANVFKAPRGTRGSALAQTGTGVLVAGQRSGHNMYYLDGVSVTDQYFNHLVASPPVDSIAEFNIQKSIYPAEFGGKASATISSITKSGANAIHGAGWEFFRNNALNARNFFDPSNKPVYHQNQYGATFGGAIVQDKTFYFLSYEGLQQKQSQTQTFSVPTTAVRTGNFAGLGPIYDPLSTDTAGNRTVYANNQIPLTRLDPVAQAFQQKLPLPNLPGQKQNLLATPALTNGYNNGVVRLDHRLGPKDNLYGRAYVADFNTFQPFGSSQLNETLVPGFGYNLTTQTKNIAIGETHVFSPNLVSEFRFGFLRVTGGQQSQNQGTNFAALAGIGGIAPRADQTGFPSVNFSGLYSTAGDPSNLFTRRDNSFDIMENLSYIRGAHSLKFGAYIFGLQFNPSESPNARGTFTYSPRYTSSAAGLGNGNAYGDFLLGYPTSAQAGQGPGGSEYGRSLWTQFYVQDDWRVTRSLTVNIGLRYEINGQMTDTQNRLSNVELNRVVIASDSQGNINPAANAMLSLIPVPWVTSKQAGYDRSLQLPNYHRLAPRIGLAWNIDNKTVIRAGWGLFFNQAAYSIQTSLTENLPFYFNKNVNTAATTLIPTLTTSNILLSNASGTIGGSTMDYPYRSEFADSWSFEIQRQLANKWVLTASYFGSHVTGADNSTYRNVPTPGPGAIDPRRPNPVLSAFKAIRWDGWSIYNSATLTLEKRLSRGSTLNVNYTWSKSIDDASDAGATFSEANIPQDVYNQRNEHALSSFNHTHRFVFSYSYALPFQHSGAMGRLVNNWVLTGLGSAQSGAPFNVVLGTDNANIGAGPSQRANVSGNPNQNAPHTAQQWFNTSVFSVPAPFTFGNAGRNIVFGDNEINYDMSVQKDIPLNERVKLQFRAEMFNFFNHTNFADSPGRTLTVDQNNKPTGTFGQYTSALNPRLTQFALKILF